MSLEERYEIRSKIGQGGVGAVYRAFDRHLNREVAIKRVLAEGGYENQEDATQAMLQEATALCSVQHPHIVTVFDAGVDKDGPYVVMELLSGRTIDEMIERGILTKEDFREVAVQSQEALIAAQDLDLVHRDIKPTNLMVTWLASGRFQVKLVDFGLAKFSPKPSLQTIDHSDAVFGSIHFMAPEQFERTPLDKRTDMYSLGCVYYYCLAGRYPFDGQNAAQVMTAHLQNSVTPISELRPDLPKWMSDWVMWHLSRSMDQRPENARESLQTFLMSENNPENETSENQSSHIQAGPSLSQPQGASSQMVNTATAPQPIQPPEGQAPSIHTAAQKIKAPSAQINRPRLLIPGQGSAPTTPDPAAPAPVTVEAAAPPASPLVIPTNPTPENSITPDPAAPAPAAIEAAQAAATPEPPNNPVTIPTEKQGLSTPVKAVIAATLVAAIIVASFVFIGKKSANDKIKELNSITAPFKDIENPPTEAPLNQNQIQLLLDTIASSGVKEQGERETYLQALLIGKSTDGSDISEMVASFAKTTSMDQGNRIKLFRLLGIRAEESAFPHLIAFAKTTDDTNAGQAALNATKNMASTKNFKSLINIITSASNPSIKSSARNVLGEAIRKSDTPGNFAKVIINTYNNATDDDSKTALLRLMGAAGGDEASAIINDILNGENLKMKAAAAYALRDWPDDSQFDTLFNYTSSEQDDRLRSEAFKASVDFLRNGPEIDKDKLPSYWKKIALIATTSNEQKQTIDSMVAQNEIWASDILDLFIEDAVNDKIQWHAEKAKEHLAQRMKRAKRSRGKPEKGAEK